MKSLQEQLEIYSSHHTKKTTKITHYIGVPAIIIAAIMFLNWISIQAFGIIEASFAWLAFAAIAVYYFLLNKKLGVIASIILAIMTLVITAMTGTTPNKISLILFLILFVGGWILQFIGHYFEEQKPAFLESISQLFIAPLYFLIILLKAIGLKNIPA